MWFSLLILGFSMMSLSGQNNRSSAGAAPQKRHIYLLIGQSNMAGRAPLSANDQKPIGHCELLNAADEWEAAKHPLNRHSTIRKGLGMQKGNPGGSFAKAMLAKNPKQAIGLVVNAKGGTRIEEWAKGGTFYNEAVRRARIAQKSGTLKGILWHQGESNSKNPGPYLANLKTLIEDLRKDLGALDLPFVAGQIYYHPKHKPHTLPMNQIIASLPDAVPHTGYASTEELTTLDHTHFDAKGMAQLGERYAAEMLRLQGGAEKKK